MIRLLMNLKLRRKLMIAMVPLALMVVLAGLYASYQIKWIDKQYSELIDNDIKTLQSVTSQRALTMRFGMSLYNLIAETDPQRVRLIESELDSAQEKYRLALADSLRQSPALSADINATALLFE